ncbi:MAG: ABC transporter ATP-binding protein [Candidatus Thiodiazotropha taylori]
MPNNRLLALQDMCISIPAKDGKRQLVSGISLEIQKGKCIALVGESGSGKTISCLATLGLFQAAEIEGQLVWKDRIFDLSHPHNLKDLRGGSIAMLPQNYAAAFNPVRTIGAQMVDVIRFRQGKNKNEALDYATELLDEMGISLPKKRLGEFPHQQSGGILQRTALAMALSCEPELLIADEPTSALDVTTQKVLLDLLERVKSSHALTLLLVSHNLAIVSQLADEIHVMAGGEIQESGRTQNILTDPQTKAAQNLLRAAKALVLP